MNRPELTEFGLNESDKATVLKCDMLIKDQERIKTFLKGDRFFQLCLSVFFGLLGFLLVLAKMNFKGDLGASLLGGLCFFCYAYFIGEVSESSEKGRFIQIILKAFKTMFFTVFLFSFLLSLYITRETFLSLAVGIIAGCAPYLFRSINAVCILYLKKPPADYYEKKKRYEAFYERERAYAEYTSEQKRVQQEQRIKAKEEAREVAARATQAAEKEKKTARQHLEFWQGLDGVGFEQELATLLRDSGYKNVSLTAVSGDDGIDLWADDPDGNPCIFQCKAYQNTVSPAQVRELLGALKSVEDKANYAVMVALSGVTGGAEKFAEKNKILIWDGDDLVKMAKEFFKKS